jgi:hypothetical protein
MVWLRTTGIAAMVLALAGFPAAAREPDTRQELGAITAELIEKLRLLETALETEAPQFPTDILSQAFEAAMPVLPAGDERRWGTTFAFDFESEVATGALEPDGEGPTVLTDARGCTPEGSTAEIIHFSRFTRGSVRGHRCIIVAGEGGAMQSKTYAEGPDRRLTAYYGVAMSVSGEPDEARRRLEARMDQNVALAGIFADYALEMFIRREAGTAASEEPFAARLDRMNERLADIAAALEAPATTPDPAP